MIFVTLGSQKFQFNRLLQRIDELISQGTITDEVFAQIGYSNYHPQYYEFRQFLDREEFTAIESKADIVITHGGTGSIIGAVRKAKKVIAIPRLAKYGEHVDDHQIQLLKQFDGMGIIEVCYDLNHLDTAYQEIKTKSYCAYQSNTDQIINSIESFLIGGSKQSWTTY